MNLLLDAFTGRYAWVPPLAAAPFVGSFIGVLIDRLPEGRPIALARSRCNHCRRTLSALDMFPWVSFAVLRGRCRMCGAPIGWSAPAVELGATAIAVWAASVVQDVTIWISCSLGWVLLACGWIDLHTMLLPDVLTLPLLIGGLGTTALLDPESLSDHAAAAAAGYLLLFFVSISYRIIRGRNGLGLGDAKLTAALGAWVGLSALPLILLIASCIGLAAAVVLRVSGHVVTAQTRLPFGPCIAAAGWLMWLYGDNVIALTDGVAGRLF